MDFHCSYQRQTVIETQPITGALVDEEFEENKVTILAGSK